MPETAIGRGLTVPVGGRDDTIAIRTAGYLARQLATEVTLIHVETDPFATRNVPAESLVVAEWNRAARFLERRVQLLRRHGVRSRAVVRQGIVDAEIVAEAAERGAGLVVMANRPRRGPLWFGGSDESRELVRNGSLPVVLVNQDRPPITRLRTILAPVERVHAPGLVYALALARAAHARLVLLRVVGRVGANASAAELESEMKSLVDQADAIVCEVRVAGAPVAESIITTAGQVGADLLAMTTSPTDRLGGTWLGKIVEAVRASAPQPVLLVHQQRVASLTWSASGE